MGKVLDGSTILDPARRSALSEQILSLLRQEDGIILLENFPDAPDDGPLLALCKELGAPYCKKSLNSEGGIVDRVEARGQGFTDPHGNKVLSTTSAEFTGHTDGTDQVRPYDIVLLLCVQPSPSGGETVLFRVDDLLAQLSVPEIRLLQEPVYPFHGGSAPVLTLETDRYAVRYNRTYINNFHARGAGALTPRHIAALDRFDEVMAVAHTAKRFKLEANDCLIIQNRRVLHGRTAFYDGEVKRLLKRVRLYFHTSAGAARAEGFNGAHNSVAG